MRWLVVLALGVRLGAQTVQPVIAEFTGKAEGRFTVTNNTLTPMVVLLEPKSFSITPEGKGMFRALDSGTHVELSTTSLKLAPQQTSYVFYRADATMFPAWFTIYATFSQPRHSGSLDVRIMLPHTVYMYQKQPPAMSEMSLKHATYSAETRKVVFDLENRGAALGRAQTVNVSGSRGNAEGSGFPMLPGARRVVEIPWTGKEVPSEVDVRFEHFTLKAPIEVVDVTERGRQMQAVPLTGFPLEPKP